MARESESGAGAAGPYWGSADSFRLLAEHVGEFQAELMERVGQPTSPEEDEQ